MTVKELKKKLSRYPDDFEIYLSNSDYYIDIEKIKKVGVMKDIDIYCQVKPRPKVFMPCSVSLYY